MPRLRIASRGKSYSSSSCSPLTVSVRVLEGAVPEVLGPRDIRGNCSGSNSATGVVRSPHTSSGLRRLGGTHAVSPAFYLAPPWHSHARHTAQLAVEIDEKIRRLGKRRTVKRRRQLSVCWSAVVARRLASRPQVVASVVVDTTRQLAPVIEYEEAIFAATRSVFEPDVQRSLGSSSR